MDWGAGFIGFCFCGVASCSHEGFEFSSVVLVFRDTGMGVRNGRLGPFSEWMALFEFCFTEREFKLWGCGEKTQVASAFSIGPRVVKTPKWGDGV